MRYWQHFADDPDEGTLLRENGDLVEVLRHDTLEWTPTPSLVDAWNLTQDWDAITATDAARIELAQRRRALATA